MDSLEFLGIVNSETVGLFDETYLFDLEVGPLVRQHDVHDAVERLRVAIANGHKDREEAIIAQIGGWVPGSRVVQIKPGLVDIRAAGDGDASAKVQQRVDERLAALNGKDFKRADEIRAALLAEGVQLMDSKTDAGERVTKWEIKR